MPMTEDQIREFRQKFGPCADDAEPPKNDGPMQKALDAAMERIAILEQKVTEVTQANGRLSNEISIIKAHTILKGDKDK